MDRTEARSPGRESIPLCLRCVRPRDPASTFCPNCGAPSAYAATGPFESAVMQGVAYGSLVRAKRPTLSVLAGGWLLGIALLSIPAAPFFVGGRGEGGLEGAARRFVGLSIGALVVWGLWRLTAHYVRSHRRRAEAPPGPPPTAP